MHGGRGEEEETEEVLPRATMHSGRGEEEEKEEEVLPRATMHGGGGGGDEDEEDEDEASTPDWILRAADRLAAKIVFERMSTEAVGELASSTGPGSRQRRRQKRATLLRWLRWLAALSFSSLLLILAIGVLRPMAGPAVLSSGIGSQLALFGASDAEACDATGALSTLQAAMQDSSELLRDAMSRGDSAAHAAAKAQVRTPWPHAPWPHATSTGRLRCRRRGAGWQRCPERMHWLLTWIRPHAHASPHPGQAGLEAAERRRGETAELLRLTAAELKALKELLAAKEEARSRLTLTVTPDPDPGPTRTGTLKMLTLTQP